MLTFRSSLNELNRGQRECVESIYGSHFVIAAPGTGKTQIIGLRVANMLLSDSQIEPSNILCLTFTEAGAIAMKRRLVSLIGATGYNVPVYTFHAFCNEVIQNNLDYFGIRNYEPMSDLDGVDIVHEIIDGLDEGHVLKRLKGDIYYETDRMVALFNFMKEEGITVQQMVEECDSEIAQLPMEDRFIYKRANQARGIKVGDLKHELIEAETEKLNKTKEAARLLPLYVEKQKEHKVYDYQDMIRFVADAFENDDNSLLFSYQERYQFIMVDEFQDTNGSQNRLLKMLLSFWDDPNIMVVADDDQCIYEFVGARIHNMYEFVDMFHPRMLNVEVNYRSGSDIIDAANRLITNNKHRITVNKGVKPSGKRKGSVRCIRATTMEIEDFYVYDEIRRLHSNGVKYSDIGVIYRKHRQAKNLMSYLIHNGIPVNSRRKIDVLRDSTLVFKMLNMLKGHEYCTDDLITYMNQFILYGFMGDIITMDDYLAIEGKNRHAEATKSESVERYQLAVKNVHKAFKSEKLLKAFSMFISEYLIIPYIEKSEKPKQLLYELNAFYSFMENCVTKNPNIMLREFLSMIKRMQENNIPIYVDNLGFDEDGVFMTTAHGAKGLEFEHVYLIGCVMDEWEGSRKVVTTYKYPDSLIFDKRNGDADEEVNRRLFYVSMTRAKESLTMLFHTKNETMNRETDCSKFIIETGCAIEDIESVKIEGYANSIPNYLQSRMASLIDSLGANTENDSLIKEVIDNYRLSASGLNKYLRCPKQFYYEDILRIRTHPTYQMIVGNVIHGVMKRYYDSMREIVDGETMLEGFVYGDKKIHREYFMSLANEEFMRYVIYLNKNEIAAAHMYFNKAISIYTDMFIDNDNHITLNEYRIGVTTIEETPVVAIFDKLEFDGNNVIIVDYKTGSEARTLREMQPPSEKNPNGGELFRQMLFYKLALDSIYYKPWSYHGNKVIIFGESGISQHDIEMTLAHENQMGNLIKTVYGKIKNMDFTTGCSECSWCKHM